MRLFIDNNLPPALARALAAMFADDHEIACHRDKFGDTQVKDEEWIPQLGREGDWVVLSGDLNIARKRPQRELFFQADLVGFFPRTTVMQLPLQKSE